MAYMVLDVVISIPPTTVPTDRPVNFEPPLIQPKITATKRNVPINSAKNMPGVLVFSDTTRSVDVVS